MRRLHYKESSNFRDTKAPWFISTGSTSARKETRSGLQEACPHAAREISQGHATSNTPRENGASQWEEDDKKVFIVIIFMYSFILFVQIGSLFTYSLGVNFIQPYLAQ